MFCPSCGARNPDGSRFCKTCGTDLSSRGAGTTASQAATQAPAPGAPAFARPAAAARGRSTGRRRVIAGIAAAVAVALVVAVGLRTSWFGLAQPHPTPGTYTFTSSLVDSSLALHTTTAVLSVTEDGSATLAIDGQSIGGNAQVSWAGRDHLYVQVPIMRASLGLGENQNNRFGPVSNSLKSIAALRLGDDQSLTFSIHFVFPRGAPDSIVGTWATWITDENGSTVPYGDMNLFIWCRFEDDGSFRGGYVSPSDTAAAIESLKTGTFQGNSNMAVSGSWTKQNDGSFVLNTPVGSSINTFQYHR